MMNIVFWLADHTYGAKVELKYSKILKKVDNIHVYKSYQELKGSVGLGAFCQAVVHFPSV